MTLGLVCDVCDALSALNATACKSCGASLGVIPRPAAASPPPVAASARACANCGAEIPPNHRFCGNCGQPIAAAPLPQAPPPPSGHRVGGSKTMFFSAIQQPGQVKLTLIRGDGMDGVTYMLSANEHIAGRSEGALTFPDDTLLSPRHCNFICRDGKLFVRDEGSVNGIFVRIIRPQQVASGSLVLVGEQLLQVEVPPSEQPAVPDDEGTYFYASPKRPSRVAITQILAGGVPGLVFRARDEVVSVGRESNDINFPDDPFISGRHATIQAVETPQGSRLIITDLGSKNGTFIRVTEESSLLHGDYVFIGQQLLRVEIT